MANKQTLQQFREHVFKQSVLRSGLFGLLIGLTVAFVTALVSWFFGYDGGLWLSIGLLVGVSAISGVALYFVKFRATDALVARRVDMLGLRERIVTMIELEGEESFMAKRQREDAEEKLKMVSPKQLKFRLARKAIASIITAAVIAPAMMVVCELAALGILNSGMEIINPDASTISEILVTYEADEGGSIDGDEDQIILPGEETKPVLAVADEGWVFVGWSDGYTDPYREGDVVQEDTIFTALFEEIEPEEEAGSGGNGFGEGEGEGAGDQPGFGNGNGNGNGNGQGQGDGNGNGQGDGAGGTHSVSNNIIDGNTDYGPYLSDAIESAMDSIVDGSGDSSIIGEIISDYFGAL